MVGITSCTIQSWNESACGLRLVSTNRYRPDSEMAAIYWFETDPKYCLGSTNCFSYSFNRPRATDVLVCSRTAQTSAAINQGSLSMIITRIPWLLKLKVGN